jgi:DNA-binding response OmpR family regulator
MKLLLIEDNIELAQKIVRYLSGNMMTCVLREDGQSGYQEAVMNNYNVILLDIEIPVMNGLLVCKRLREEGSTIPIIMLTSRGREEDIIEWLNSGADDYLGKPFDYGELVARIQALARRNMSTKSTTKIILWDLTIDQEKQMIEYRWKNYVFSRRAYDLLLYLAQNHTRVIPKDELAEEVWWIYDLWEEQKVVEMYISYIRKRLWRDIIQTSKWIGYILNP